ncbi:hypothetical protein D3C81_983620 [compost metagenome]
MKLRFERRISGFQLRRNAPVFFRNKFGDFVLPIQDDFQRNRLYAAKRHPFFDLLPQQRADLVTNQPIQNPSGLLRVHKIHIDLAWGLERIFHRLLRNFIKYDTACFRLIHVQNVGQMPGNRFAFAIGVSCQIDFFYFFAGIL